MSTKLQRNSWARPLFGSLLLVLAIACFVQISHTHRMRTGAALPLQASATARRGHIASQRNPSVPDRLPVIDPVLTYSTFLGGTNSSGPAGPQQQAYASF